MYALTLLLALTAQRPDSFTAQVREYITVDTSLLALTHVLLVDGTGAAPKANQTIVLRAGRIVSVGPSSAAPVPDGAKTLDLSGSTVIPGLVGMHDHLFYTAAGGRAVHKAYTDIRRAELGAAIQEAHKRGVKVTGHLCSVSFQEAVALGIDNLEHGMLTASDFTTGKQADVCPVNLMSQIST